MAIAAAYVRVSTQQQKDDGSHIGQREEIAEWATGMENIDIDGWDEYHSTDGDGEVDSWESIDGETTGDVAWFEDIAISGQAEKRKGYDRLMDSYQEYDVVVFRELSRFGRDPVQVTKHARDIMDDGLDFISIKEPEWDSTSAAGKFLMRQFANMNAFYADLRREQAIKAVERRKEQGLPVGRPQKVQGDMLDDVFDLREKGVSYSAIARIVEDKPEGPDEISRETIRRYCDEEGVTPEWED